MLIAAFAAFTMGEDHAGPQRGLVLWLGIVLGVAWILICWSPGFDDSHCPSQILKLESGQLEKSEKQELTRF
ncbi:MAG: hypothetical protein GTO63_13700 [Anaerolineae bacterium]|nr:hypothetical protein [Anaerolineae bacterium]NIN95894.1 hypothetical protein [Anaerolineae bacterium]NIQ78866.1 hypothetical protein [Anaerolineae bacterium]